MIHGFNDSKGPRRALPGTAIPCVSFESFQELQIFSFCVLRKQVPLHPSVLVLMRMEEQEWEKVMGAVIANNGVYLRKERNHQ